MFGRNLNRDLLNLSIMTLITVITWAGFDIYRAYNKVEIPQVLQRQILPLDPKLDREVLAGLKEREFISREEAKETLEQPIEKPEENLFTGEEATESATPGASLE